MESKRMENRINEIIETTLKNISQIIDVNTVIGKPINYENGDYIVPVAKVTVGVLIGGGEYGKNGLFKNNDLPYSAGNGAIISIKPSGVIVKEKENFKLMSISENPTEKIFEKATEIISNLQVK